VTTKTTINWSDLLDHVLFISVHEVAEVMIVDYGKKKVVRAHLVDATTGTDLGDVQIFHPVLVSQTSPCLGGTLAGKLDRQPARDDGRLGHYVLNAASEEDKDLLRRRVSDMSEEERRVLL
jgi:hypothetical protein